MPTSVAKIPDPIPRPYSNFFSGWRVWAATLHGKPLFLGKKSFLSTSQGGKPGHIINSPLPPPDVKNWLPADWIIDIVPAKTSQPKSCDCPSRKLFIQGCPGH